MRNRTPTLDEERGAGFRTNFAIIVTIHIALIAACVLIARNSKAKPAEEVTWLDGGDLAAIAEPASPSAPPEPPDSANRPVPSAPSIPPAPLQTPSESNPSEITDRKPTPTPTPKPTPKPVVASTPTPKTTSTPKPSTPPPNKKPPKPVVKSTTPKPTKTVEHAKIATPKPAENVSATPKPSQPTAKTAESGTPNSTTAAGNSENPGTRGGPGAQGGSATATEKQTYNKIVGGRFNQVWNPPLTTIATGRDLVFTLRVRVSADGTVKSATMSTGTGNREVDASVETAIPRFQKVPPPPASLLSNGELDTQIGIALDL